MCKNHFSSRGPRHCSRSWEGEGRGGRTACKGIWVGMGLPSLLPSRSVTAGKEGLQVKAAAQKMRRRWRRRHTAGCVLDASRLARHAFLAVGAELRERQRPGEEGERGEGRGMCPE